MSLFKFIKAIESAGQSPCEKFSCRSRQQCASEMLACSAFRYYVNKGPAANPCLDMPVRATERQKPVLRDAPIPTREIYDAIHNDERTEEQSEDAKEARAKLVSETVESALRSRGELERLILAAV